jgi:hypothetical protein
MERMESVAQRDMTLLPQVCVKSQHRISVHALIRQASRAFLEKVSGGRARSLNTAVTPVKPSAEVSRQ